jgi:hypothetical protein
MPFCSEFRLNHGLNVEAQRPVAGEPLRSAIVP